MTSGVPPILSRTLDVVSSTSGLPFAEVLTEEAIQKAFDDEDVRFADDEDAVCTAAITLWAFLSEVLFKDEQRSCVAAVARVKDITMGQEACFAWRRNPAVVDSDSVIVAWE